MSEIKTDKLTGVTTAGSIAVTGEGNTVTTNLQQGLAKAWALIDLDNATPVNFDSLNLGTITDNGTADLTQNLTNNMVNQNFAHAGYPMATGTSVQGRTASGHSGFPTTAGDKVRHLYGYPASLGGLGAAFEDTQANFLVHGDLA